MNAWTCALLIGIAGACGGFLNALLTDNGFPLPHVKSGVWCPGALTNIMVGAFASFASWALYGSGEGVELLDISHTRTQISLRFSALAGAFLIGVAGARWLTNESDKLLLKEGVKSASSNPVAKSPEECKRLGAGSA